MLQSSTNKFSKIRQVFHRAKTFLQTNKYHKITQISKKHRHNWWNCSDTSEIYQGRKNEDKFCQLNCSAWQISITYYNAWTL